ncbi:IS4 family transposase [Methylohalobius crimeensis]|uniref:IS4 family transposase n=2 Tax=Methylohalobius crimeensis TaxID=244365 RepID=UPI000407D3DA|nr:IS4 family transposase [Methylohalobius crimeensis]
MNDSVSALRAVLAEHLPWHGARLNFLAQFLLALFQVRSVNLAELATAFRGKAQVASHYKRLQRFFRGFTINYDVLARLLVHLFAVGEGPWYLTLDRTNWKLGKIEINFLVLGIAQKGMALPVLWTVLGKAGNSHTDQRIELMQRFLANFGKTRIRALLADREFVGQKWFTWLQTQGIPFHIRIKENTRIPNTWNRATPAWLFFRSLRPGQMRHLEGRRPVWDCFIHISALRLADNELLIVATHGAPQSEAFTAYGQRWEIETLFGALKSRGFNLEDTHLTHPDRLSKLLALLALAFAWSWRTGEVLTEQKPIEVKKRSSDRSSPSSDMASISSAISSSTSSIDGRIFYGY